jgi:hypothetical protein
MHSLKRSRQAVRPETITSRRLGSESGFIMVVAIAMLAASLVLIAAVATSAVHVNKTAARTAASGRALAAANAGAQVALFRLDNDGVTAGATGSVGNGATYNYAITTLGPTGSTGVTGCTGLSVQSSSQTVQQDCITSVGSVNGVNAQVQTRVAGYVPQSSLFPVAGVFAETSFTTTQLNGTFSLGSNGLIDVHNATASQLDGDIEYLSGDLYQSQNSNQMCNGTCVPELLTSKITTPTLADSAYANAATTNSDATGMTLTNATLSAHVITAISDSATNGAAFAPGVYYLCGINAGGFNSFSITTSGSGLVQIYIDSPNRPGSTCAAGTGNIYGAGNGTAALDNTEGNASNLQVYFYGQPGCTSSCPPLVTPANMMTVRADIFAPNSQIVSGGAFAMTGALTINSITAQNNFTVTYQAPTSGGGGAGAYTDFFPARQTTCPPSSTPTTTSC